MRKAWLHRWGFTALLSCLAVAACGDGTGGAGPAGPRPDMPPRLPFFYVRPDPGAPIPPEAMRDFSERIGDFFRESGYVGWLLRMSHGVDASTGRRGYRLWWEEVQGEKHGDLVTIAHIYSEEHGGHNILKANSLILASAIAGAMGTGDPVLVELAAQFCRGVSSTMLGMVYDDSDPVRHLMARNVVTFNHTYTTHDGRRKSVDYSPWFHAYDRWNCSRFRYDSNPDWGPVTVTNTRSKDGLGYLLDASVSVALAAAYAVDPALRAACGETHDLLTRFARDMVDHGYLIRSKDRQGTPYRPGVDPEPPEARVGDLASLTRWDPLFPDAECNATQATALRGYGERLENDCAPFGGHRLYELGAILNNPPNAHIMRSFHMANVALALEAGDPEAARKALTGLEERFARDQGLDPAFVGVPEDAWRRDLALSWLQAASVGYCLTSDEVREIHTYALRAVEEYQRWENWDLWADTVPEGEALTVFPPDRRTEEDGRRTYWFQPYALAQFLETCWGIYRNPDCPRVIDCGSLGF